MIRYVSSRGYYGIERCAINIAHEYDFKIKGYTPYKEMTKYNLEYIEKGCNEILNYNKHITDGVILFNIDDKLDCKMGNIDKYSNKDYKMILIEEINQNELRNVHEWINKYNITKLNIHGHFGYDMESYNFFNKLFDNLYKE